MPVRSEPELCCQPTNFLLAEGFVATWLLTKALRGRPVAAFSSRAAGRSRACVPSLHWLSTRREHLPKDGRSTDVFAAKGVNEAELPAVAVAVENLNDHPLAAAIARDERDRLANALVWIGARMGTPHNLMLTRSFETELLQWRGPDRRRLRPRHLAHFCFNFNALALIGGGYDSKPIYKGEHIFCQIDSGKCEGAAKFNMIWESDNGAWKLTRIVSYGHRTLQEGELSKLKMPGKR